MWRTLGGGDHSYGCLLAIFAVLHPQNPVFQTAIFYSVGTVIAMPELS